ncbi:hypothetical protein RV18_GL000652 [Enterococcus termitis]|nr:hypothetical protein RV18_GL000652 [Enterococcus termitis]
MFDGVVVFFQEHTSFTYQLLFGLTIILGLVFAVPTILYGAEEASTDTPLGVENQVSLSSVSLTLIERGYNPETNYAEIFLKVNGNLASRSKLDLIAGEEKNQVEVPAKIIRLTENYYTIQMSSIPNNWRNIIIDIAEISENDSAVEILDASKLFENFGVKKEKDKAKITQSQIYFNRKKVSIDTQAKPQNETMYLIKCLDMEIEESTKFIKNNKEAIVDFNKKIKTIEDEISDIESEKKYQTATEIKQAEDRIQSKKSTISDIKTKIESAKESNIELLEKISKLEQQKADVSSKE